MWPSPKPRIFLNSNVIFSGMYPSTGAPGVILERFIDGKLTVVISRQVLEEVVSTIKAKLPDAFLGLRRLLMSAPPEIIKDPAPAEVARWAEIVHIKDAGILAAAIAAQPDYLVTGDKHFLGNPNIAQKSGLHIVTPTQLLQLLEKDN